MENCSFSISIEVEDQPTRRRCFRISGVYVFILKSLVLILVLIAIIYTAQETYFTLFSNSMILDAPSSSTTVFINTTIDASITSTSPIITITEDPWSSVWPPIVEDNIQIAEMR